MTRAAAVDCGTNSIRLLIADVDGSSVVDVVREMRIVRLGQGVDATGRFADEALKRVFDACDEFAELIDEHGPMPVRFVATSATRDAENRDEFIAGVKERLGVAPEVISGEEEASLSFLGASAGVSSRVEGGLPQPVLVMDLGGGSTELVVGSGTAGSGFSMNIGCVRMTERHITADPISDEQIAAVEADVDAAFDEAAQHVDIASARALVGVAGTITTLTAAALELDAYVPDAIHGAQLSSDEVSRTVQSLIEMASDERAKLPYMHPGRVDVIVGGAIVYRRLIRRIEEAVGGSIPIVTSEADILDGIAIDLAERSS